MPYARPSKKRNKVNECKDITGNIWRYGFYWQYLGHPNYSLGLILATFSQDRRNNIKLKWVRWSVMTVTGAGITVILIKWEQNPIGNGPNPDLASICCHAQWNSDINNNNLIWDLNCQYWLLLLIESRTEVHVQRTGSMWIKRTREQENSYVNWPFGWQTEYKYVMGKWREGGGYDTGTGNGSGNC